VAGDFIVAGPNDEDADARKRYGQSRATLLSFQEAEDLRAHPGAYNRLPYRVPWTVRILAILLAAGLMSCGGCLGVHWITRASMAARFEKDLQAYAALMPALPPEVVEQGRLPPQRITGKVKGKMVVVNRNERRVDEVYFALPDDLRAAKPEEVATVVLLTWGKTKMSDDGPMSHRPVEYQQFVQVKVFDWESKREIACGTVCGGFPEHLSRTGPKPENAQVRKFLAGLPRE
jgi:hypothetical protein